MQILFAPESTPFMVALALLALLALTQLAGLLHLGGEGNLHLHGDAGAHAEADFAAGLASLLGLGRLPLLAWLSLLLAVFALGGLTLQQVVAGLTGHLLPAAPAGGLALLGALTVTGLLSRPLSRVWPQDETSAIDIEALLARRGRIDIGIAARGHPARAVVRDQTGQMHLVMVEPHEEGTSLREGEEVLLVRREGELFYAIACDPPFLTAGD